MPVVVRRALAAVLAVAVTVVTAVALPPGGASPVGAQTGGFYTPPSPLPSGANGDVIKTQPFTYAGASTATRIMYLSRDIQNRPMAVTGTVLVPSTPWSGSGPRPIVAYAPFTAGLGDQCAASHTVTGDSPADLVSGVQTGWVNALLSRGIAVAQTDYQGLGTPGDHTYVMRVPQARAVLDVIRAAQRLPATGLPAAGPVGIAGYSQGGGAAAAAAELAPTYAPELSIQGVYAGAPVADLGVLAGSLDGSMYVAFLGYALVGIDAAYEEVDLNVLANEQGRAMLTEARTTCTLDAVFRYMFRQTSTLTITGQPVREFLGVEPFNRIVAENKVGNIRPSAPVLVEHSWIDDVLPQAQAKQMARDWCGRGANVQWRDIFTIIPLFTHLFEANTAANNAANWLAGRFRGTAATPNCGQF
jgi:hypothetical protein